MSVLFETDRALPLIQLAVSLMTGAGQDPEGHEGLTRLLMRLMRRTGGGRSPEQLDEHLDALGSSLGVDVGFSSCGFAGSVIARSVDEYVETLTEVIAAPGLGEDELARLKRETLEEILEIRDNDRALARMWFRAALFGEHVYGRNVVGTKSSLEGIGPSDLRAHYDRMLSANNLVFALAGDVKEGTARGIAKKIQSALPDVDPPTEEVLDPSGPQGRRLLLVDKPERTQTQILIGTLGTHPRDVDHTALVVANTVFGGTFTARLSQEVRAKRGWSYGAYSSLPYDRRRQAFSMWTFPAAADAAACIELQLSMLEQWIDEGITQEELDWGKSYLVNSNVFNMDTAAKRMGLLLDESIYGLPTDYYKDYPSRVQSVTLQQANAALRARLSAKNLVITVVGTAADIAEPIRAAIPDLSQAKTVAFDDDPVCPWEA